MAVERFKNDPKVDVCHDSSVNFLQKLFPILKDESVFYWLDAHWCVADEAAGYASQCSVLDELSAIRQMNAQSVICIDDARLFLCPPPKPHKIEDWPSFDAIVKKLYTLSSTHEIMVVNDVIVCYPSSTRDIVKTYAYEHSIDWLSVLNKSREYDLFLPRLEADSTARLEALEATDAALRAVEAEAAQRLAALEATDAALRAVEAEAAQRLAGLQELTAVIAARDERIAEVEQMAAEREDMLRQAITKLQNESLLNFLGRRAKGLLSRKTSHGS